MRKNLETNEDSGRYSSLQALRFLAAFAVMVFHVNTMMISSGNLTSRYFRLLESGVDIFFVLSGFIMAYTTRSDRDVGRFIIKRLTRIVPLYWLLTFPAILLGLALPNLLLSTEVNWKTIIKSLLFLPVRKN